MDEFQLELTDAIASKDVALVIQNLWVEAIGELDKMLSVPIDEIKHENIAAAEGILLKLKKCILENDQNKIDDLTRQFYSLIPHNMGSKTIDSIRLIRDKQDLCQLIRDMINVSELTDWKISSSINAKLKALKCYIQDLHSTSSEFSTIKNYLLSSCKRYYSIK